MVRATLHAPSIRAPFSSPMPHAFVQCNPLYKSPAQTQIGTVSMVGLFNYPQLLALFNLHSWEMRSLGPYSPLIIGVCLPRKVAKHLMHDLQISHLDGKSDPLLLYASSEFSPLFALFASFVLSPIICLVYSCSASPWRPPGPQTTFLICNPNTELTSFYFPPGFALRFDLTFLKWLTFC